MQKVKYNFLTIKPLFIYSLFYSTVLLGFYFNEDSLGGAKADFLYHYNISQKFSENFFLTFSTYGTNADGMNARNSPVFWILISYLNNFISSEFLRLINSFSSILISFLFYRCLIIKFKNVDKFYLLFFSCILFLSPTIRSVSIWPSTLNWGLVFFLVSLLNYLKFVNTLSNNKKDLYIYYTIFFVAISAYLHPSFATFYIFYVFNFSQHNKFGIKTFYLLLFSLILAAPSLFYIISKDFLSSFQAAQGIQTSNIQSLNLANKILIVSTMVFFFIIPVLNLKILINKINDIKLKEFSIIVIFCLINIYLFNYPAFDSGLGGGFFYKISNVLFGNNLIFYILSILSIISIYLLLEKNFNNYLLLFILIIYTPQLTIYNKYYDPLILIIFSILINFNFKDHFFKKYYKFLQLYFISVVYLLIGIFKSQIF